MTNRVAVISKLRSVTSTQKPHYLLDISITEVLVTVDSNKLKYRPGTIYAGFPAGLGFGVRGQSYSNLIAASTVELKPGLLLRNLNESTTFQKP